MNSDRLTVENVCKNYGRQRVLQDVSLSVSAGERVALLGHNGAGKTTLIKLILGLTALSAGKIDVFGHPTGSDGARGTAAYLPEIVNFHAMLSGREQLRYLARLAGVSSKEVDRVLEKVGLAHAADKRIGTYSKGMRQRLGLAQVIMRRPQLALLDEPTSGLDPVSRRTFYDLVDELARTGTAVFVSSHALTELEARTDRIHIMSSGKLVAAGSLDALRREAGLPTRIMVKAAQEKADAVAARLGGERINCSSVQLTFEAGEKLDRISAIAGLERGLIEDVDLSPPSLEDLYQHFTAKGDGR